MWKIPSGVKWPGPAVETALHAWLTDGTLDVSTLDAVGHRVVHGGAAFDRAVLVDDGVVAAIRSASVLAPLHNASALEAMEVSRRVLGPAVPTTLTISPDGAKDWSPLKLDPALPEPVCFGSLVRYSGGKSPGHPIQQEISSDPWSIVKLYLLAAVWAPITEETLFRGALFHHLRRKNGWLLSSLITSFIFASIHPQGLLGIPALMMIAIAGSALVWGARRVRAAARRAPGGPRGATAGPRQRGDS